MVLLKERKEAGSGKSGWSTPNTTYLLQASEQGSGKPRGGPRFKTSGEGGGDTTESFKTGLRSFWGAT